MNHDELLELAYAKLHKLKKALILETNPAIEFQLEYQIKELKEQIETGNLAGFQNLLGLKDGLKEELKIEISRLPEPASNQFVGRGKELNEIKQLFENRDKIGIVGLIGDGGFGKSALTERWVLEVEKQGFGGLKRVLAWSFYSQGSHQRTFSSSQDFFAKALPFFGFEKQEIPQDEVDKARALVECLNKQAGLLILDGLEPLQQTPDIGGEINDIAIKELLVQLRCSRQSKSFVLISSRQEIVELKKRNDYQEVKLTNLDIEDGAKLLEILEIKGTREEYLEVSNDLQGHALSLVLLAMLLKQHKRGDIRYAKELPPLETDQKWGGHAKRVLSYYDKLLSDHERRFMYCLGLFDRPMHWKEKNALFKNAPYAQPLKNLNDLEWQDLQNSLEIKGLLLKESTQKAQRIQWDTHALIRQFFSIQFEKNDQQSFQDAHRVLFDYFQSVPQEYQPDTLEELAPLYRAVVHGCLAGEFQKALDKVYWKRIKRGDEHYSTQKLGAYSQDLTAIAAFFPQGWLQPVDLPIKAQAFLLSVASFHLMSLGRLADAVAPREANINLYVKSEAWNYAANCSESLVDLLLPIGRLIDAERAAQQAIEYAEKTDDKLRQMASYSKLATVLHRRGKLIESQQAFEKAENLQKEDQPDYPYLYSIAGAWYCGLLLDLAINDQQRKHVLERAKTISKWNIINDTALLDFALNYLTLAKTYQALQQIDEAQAHFNLAIQGIQNAKSVKYYPEFYLSRAEFYLEQNQLDSCKADIESATEIIDRSGMKLYATDAALLQSRYYLKIKDFSSADHFCDLADQLIDETDYHLRDNALAHLKSQFISPPKRRG
jgi:tetratricopeptide (TPR) repeat protein